MPGAVLEPSTAPVRVCPTIRKSPGEGANGRVLNGFGGDAPFGVIRKRLSLRCDPELASAAVAARCPCGCGRSINRLLKRTAERGVFVESLASCPTRMAEMLRDSDSDEAAKLDRFAKVGRSLSFDMIAAAHGERWATPPTAKAVGDWEADALRLTNKLNGMDPMWVLQHPLVRNRVTGKGGSRKPPQRVAAQPDPTAGVVYELGGWRSDDVKALVAALKVEGIPFAWDEKDALHVSSKYEASVNALIEEHGGTP